MLLKLINQAESVELAIGTSVNPVSAIRTSENGFTKIEKGRLRAEQNASRTTEMQKDQELLKRMIRQAKYGI